MSQARPGMCAAYSNLYPQTRCVLDGRHRGAHLDRVGAEFFHAVRSPWHDVTGMTEPRRRTTDLSRLDLPEGVVAELAVPREESVPTHAVPVNRAWWDAALREFGLPGGPVVPDGEGTLSRSFVFGLGGAVGEASSDEEVLSFLWHVLAWGSRGRNNRRRLRSIAELMPEAADLLRQACIAARESPVAGYEVLRPTGRNNAIPWLGPAFLTKVLYFAGGGASGHQALILDDRVAGALIDHGWWSLRTGGNWPTRTYERYCDLLTRWAAEASEQVGREVASDELELWLFRQGPSHK